MKHLRGFSAMHSLLEQSNESSAGLTEEQIKDFCEINLAYLMDDGLRVLVSPDYFDLKVIDYKVTLSFRSVMNKKWIEIKDQVIPFLTHLRNEYDLVVEQGSMRVPTNIRIEMIGLPYPDSTNPITYPDWFNIEDIISDKIVPVGRLNDDYKVLTIQFKIKGEKV